MSISAILMRNHRAQIDRHVTQATCDPKSLSPPNLKLSSCFTSMNGILFSFAYFRSFLIVATPARVRLQAQSVMP